VRENLVCVKISCIQVIILFLEIKFEFSLHENSVHMSKYTIFRNWVQVTQLELRIELSWFLSTQLNFNSTTDLAKSYQIQSSYQFNINNNRYYTFNISWWLFTSTRIIEMYFQNLLWSCQHYVILEFQT